jgi:enoyl-CoA hydratase
MTSPATRFVDITHGAGVCTMTLINAKSMNILGSPAIAALTEEFRTLVHDADLRVVVLRGSGDMAFIGGADINEMATLDQPSAEVFIRSLAELCDAIRACPVPVIARLAGWCLGGGLEVAISCDLRIADFTAKFGMPEVAIGIPSVIHSALLPRLIGASHSTWLLLTGETINADRAADWGLVHEVTAPDELDGRIADLATKLSGFGPQVVRQQKLLVNKWFDMPVHEAVADSIKQFGLAYRTGEPQQHMQTFLSRRTNRDA